MWQDKNGSCFQFFIIMCSLRFAFLIQQFHRISDCHLMTKLANYVRIVIFLRRKHSFCDLNYSTSTASFLRNDEFLTQKKINENPQTLKVVFPVISIIIPSVNEFLKIYLF